MSALRRRLSEEDGFTLLELMVTVLIIAIMLALAIPSMLGARKRANDRAAQANLRNALTAEKTYYSDRQAYTADVATSPAGDLELVEGSLTYAAGFPVSTSKANTIYVTTANTNVTNDTVCVTVRSGSGSYFGIRDVASASAAVTYYSNSTTAPTSCTSAFPSTTGF